MRNDSSLTADVIVVGSGPGGAAVARQLAKGGKQVLILERGRDYRKKVYYGTYLGAIRYSERRAMLFTEEGLNIIAPIMVGGATSMFAGCAAMPPPWLKDKYGIDITQEANETVAELGVKPLPEHLRGSASTRIAQAAQALGYQWYPQAKFMNPARCRNNTAAFNCRANCLLGCRCGAKWNAAEWVDEAVSRGAVLKTGVRVKRVLIEDGQAVGIEAKRGFQEFTARCNIIILAAGGIGTPRILLNSGFEEAGDGITMDTTTMVYGFTRQTGTGKEPPMTWSWENDDAGYMLSTLTDPWLLYLLAAARKGLGPALRWLRWNKMLGIMIKLKDDISGGILPDGKICKPLTADDNKRLQHAYRVCRQILIEAGADKSTIFMRPFIGTHPSGSVRIGNLLNSDLETEIQGLFVCDASVFPESLDRPTVLTIIGFAKRLAKYLLSNP
ncbi:MAG: GMC family oxidoreductase N-terminal domain-containing protein [Desulfobacterales bacterium]|jgi:choline dehydrogenase-like flavoprotein